MINLTMPEFMRHRVIDTYDAQPVIIDGICVDPLLHFDFSSIKFSERTEEELNQWLYRPYIETDDLIIRSQWDYRIKDRSILEGIKTFYPNYHRYRVLVLGKSDDIPEIDDIIDDSIKKFPGLNDRYHDVDYFRQEGNTSIILSICNSLERALKTAKAFNYSQPASLQYVKDDMFDNELRFKEYMQKSELLLRDSA